MLAQTLQGARALLNTFLTSPCAICQRATHCVFCLDCDRQLWLEPAPAVPSVLPVLAGGVYSGNLKRAILALKYGNRPDVAAPLGWHLGQQWQSSIQPLVIPIPLHPSRLRERGYNQAALIAKNFCRATGLPLFATGLIRTQATTAQYQLGPQARQQNLQGVFQLGPGWTPKQRARPIVLIDDIYTTGTTASAAALALTQGGLQVYGMGVAARATLYRAG